MTTSIQSLIVDVKRRVGIPANNERLLDSDYVAFVNEQLADDVYPFAMGLAREFYLVKESFPLQADDGTPFYPNGFVPLPKRAYGRVLREVKIVDTSGNPYNVPQINLEDYDKYQASSNSGNSRFSAFYVISDGIQFVGFSASTPGAIQLHYMLAHPAIVNSTSLYLPITRLSYFGQGLTTILTTLPVASFPDALAYAQPQSKQFYDVYRKDTGAIIASNVALTRNFSTDVFYTDANIFTSDDAQQLFSFQAGGYSDSINIQPPYSEDLYLLPAGQSQFTILPSEMDKLLVASVCGRVLETLGHYDEMDKNREVINAIKKHLSNSMGAAVLGEPVKVINRSGLSVFARRRNSSRAGY